jgi:hypothetical protein
VRWPVPARPEQHRVLLSSDDGLHMLEVAGCNLASTVASQPSPALGSDVLVIAGSTPGTPGFNQVLARMV